MLFDESFWVKKMLYQQMPNTNLYAAMCILVCQGSSIAPYQFLQTNLHAYSHLWPTLALRTSYFFVSWAWFPISPDLSPLHYCLCGIWRTCSTGSNRRQEINPLKPELNPICYLLALLAHHFLHVNRIRVKSLTIRLLMLYIYGAPILDVSRSHTTTQHSR